MKCQFFFRLALALFLVMESLTSLAQEEIFVTNFNSSSRSVTVYTRTGSGNLAPLRTLAGAATGLGSASGLAVDEVNNELLVVSNSVPYSVTVYPRTAAGNVAPLRTITGALTGLNNSSGLSVDVVNNELAVVNRNSNNVVVFARTATGNVAPLRTITSVFPVTGLGNPTGVAIDVVNNELVVANNGRSISVYARTANGNAVPLRQIVGPLNTTFNNGPLDVAVDTVNNELVVTNPTPSPGGSVLVFARTATGDVAPLRSILGGTTLFLPRGVAVDPVNNEVVVAGGQGGNVVVYARTATGTTPPLRTLAGGLTLLGSPQSVVITTGTGPAVQSRKTHGPAGAFDIAIDTGQAIGGTVTVEPRNIGTGHTIVFQFAGPITATGAVASTAGSASAAISGNDVVVTLTGIPDNSRATVSLTNVNNAGVNASASIGFLVGDVNNSRSVTATDILQVKGRSGQATDATNFKFDLNASGSITASDILAVKGRSGLVLP